MNRYLNWKVLLAVLALLIGVATLQYTSTLAGKLAEQERQDVESWAEAIQTLVASENSDQDLSFALSFTEKNHSIPVIQTDAYNKVLHVKNLDTTKVRNRAFFLRQKVAEFKRVHPPIIIAFGDNVNYIYYGESLFLTELRRFPYVQLLILLLFFGVLIYALTTAHRSLQNQVWVGLSKETAHQLGTPLTSLEGWVEILEMESPNSEVVGEMRKDLERLRLVADRFSKVGSTPVLEVEDVNARIERMVDYMRKRAPGKVAINYIPMPQPVPLALNGPLFDWVLENLLRNALDAMDGSGTINIILKEQPTYVVIDVSDSGKGIATKNINRVFKPGFSTKKRGWGLGLSLSKRIIDNYHNGLLRVKESAEGKGTTFRIQIWR